MINMDHFNKTIEDWMDIDCTRPFIIQKMFDLDKEIAEKTAEILALQVVLDRKPFKV